MLHGVALGINSILVADLGQLMILGRMKKSGDLPADFVLKTSVTLAAPNPAAARLFEDLGATSLNLPVDLTLPQIAAVRQAVDVPIDFYIESPDDFGGGVRYYEIPEMVRVAAPIYLKYGVRNSPPLYPAGRHLEGTILALSRERVRRAAIGMGILAALCTGRRGLASGGERTLRARRTDLMNRRDGWRVRASAASEPRERSAPTKRRARERVGESEGRSPSVETIG